MQRLDMQGVLQACTRMLRRLVPLLILVSLVGPAAGEPAYRGCRACRQAARSGQEEEEEDALLCDERRSKRHPGAKRKGKPKCPVLQGRSRSRSPCQVFRRPPRRSPRSRPNRPRTQPFPSSPARPPGRNPQRLAGDVGWESHGLLLVGGLQRVRGRLSAGGRCGRSDLRAVRRGRWWHHPGRRERHERLRYDGGESAATAVVQGSARSARRQHLPEPNSDGIRAGLWPRYSSTRLQRAEPSTASGSTSTARPPRRSRPRHLQRVSGQRRSFWHTRGSLRLWSEPGTRSASPPSGHAGDGLLARGSRTRRLVVRARSRERRRAEPGQRLEFPRANCRSSWSEGASWANAPALFYASGEVVESQPAAPINTALPSVSGAVVEGQTLESLHRLLVKQPKSTPISGRTATPPAPAVRTSKA